MVKTTVERLAEFGQSVWLDNISRSMIKSGRLKEMIVLGLRGMTSNPTIFDKAISSSNDYDAKIAELCSAGRSTFDIYDDLTTRDVRDAADIFKPVYDNTNRLDGYVSLEVDPRLSSKTDETVEEARRLFKKVGIPNLMIKVPATEAGYGAIERLLAEGINVNATLIFSLQQYKKTAEAFINGIERFSQKKKGDLNKVHSVASIFVSRMDTAVDKMIDERNLSLSLKGKAAVANSRLIFKEYLRIFSGDRFNRLKGASPQRVLWASTGTKNPGYSDIKYVTELMGKNTVNTLPDNTLKAFLDHGVVKEALGSDVSDANKLIEDLKGSEIDIDSVCKTLLQDGIVAFERSFESLLASIEKKAQSLCPSIKRRKRISR